MITAMCGIIGKAGDENVIPDIIDGLRRLEYRGYDSAGIAVIGKNGFGTVKTAGRVSELQRKAEMHRCEPGNTGIGHTRWATHGAPTDRNAHPHFSPDGRFSVVHNGIIENAAELKKRELSQNEPYMSDTDTEVAAHLLQRFYDGDPIKAISESCALMKGSFALGILCADFPETLFACALSSPLYAAKCKSGCYIASDTGAVGDGTEEIYKIENGEICRLTKTGIEIFDRFGVPTEKRRETARPEKLRLEKGGYEHYMMFEIMQQPDAVRDTLASLISNGQVTGGGKFPPVGFIRERLEKIQLIGCGSAYHAGLAVSSLFEKYCRISCVAQTASEYRYSDVLTDEKTLAVFISQSGETADTLAALKKAREKGASVLSVVNVEGSTMASHGCTVFTRAGRETAVATTKAYSAQLAVLYALAIYTAKARGLMTDEKERELVSELLTLPEKIAATVTGTQERVKLLASELANADSMFFIGRLSDSAAAAEGSLKMKEVSYINSQSYPAGELKHGTISLVGDGTPVIAVATRKSIFAKTCSNLSEVGARGAKTVLIMPESFLAYEFEADCVIAIPDTHEDFSCSLSVIPMQLMSYYTAKLRGCDIDKPRNLAKSVTVE